MPEAIRPYQGKVLRSAFPVMTVVFAVIVIPLLIAFIETLHIEFLVMIAGSILAAVVCIPRLKPGLNFQVSTWGINIDQGKLRIGWEQIDSCAFGNHKISPELAASLQSKPVTLYYGNESIRLSTNFPHSNSELYRDIWDILLSDNTPNLAEPLASTYRVATKKYGAKRIVAAGPSARAFQRQVVVRALLGIFILMLSAIAGAILGRTGGAAVAIAGITGIVLISILILYAVDRVKNGNKNHGSAIVLTPHQLSLQTKKLKGSLKWSELKDALLTPSPKKPIRLRLRVAGVDIVLEDYFQLPLWYLCDQAQFFRTNYLPEIQQTIPAIPNQPVIDTEEIQEDHNPFRPPRT